MLELLAYSWYPRCGAPANDLDLRCAEVSIHLRAVCNCIQKLLCHDLKERNKRNKRIRKELRLKINAMSQKVCVSPVISHKNTRTRK